MASPVPGFDPRTVIPLTIAINTALAPGVELRGFIPSVIFMPAGWDAAAITASISPDGTNWWDLYDAGTELSLTVAAGRAQALTAATWATAPGPWWRFRSGTTGTPVNQTAARTLYLLCRPIPT